MFLPFIRKRLGAGGANRPVNFGASNQCYQRRGFGGKNRSDAVTAGTGVNRMKTLVHRFVKDESGATAIEYGLIAALISVVIITVLATIGTNLTAKFGDIANNLD
jgi:pilus assembly protein Flp/PilA